MVEDLHQGSTTEFVKTNVGSGVLVSKRTQEGGFSREISSKINDKVGKFFDESFYYYKLPMELLFSMM